MNTKQLLLLLVLLAAGVLALVAALLVTVPIWIAFVLVATLAAILLLVP